MSSLWSELGRKIADRWLTLLVLPGLLYLAVAAAARTLRQEDALSVSLLARQVTAHAREPAVTSVGGQVVILGAVLIAAAAIGVVAQAIGAFFEQAVLAAGWTTWPPPLPNLISRWVRRRQCQWDAANRAHFFQYQLARSPNPADHPDPAIRHASAGKRSRIAVERPERPTWSGDRIQAAALRLDRDHQLDLAVVWPYLESVLPGSLRDQITEARAALSRAATLAGWAVLYLLLIWEWWPAALLAVLLTVAARHRLRAGADAYARLLETAARLYAPALAGQLGIEHAGPLTADLGARLTRELGTQLPPPSPSEMG
jgi:hypothetical protein